MARFKEPTNAVRDFADLEVGHVLWGVNGTYPPSKSEHPVVVVGAPVQFKTRREYSGGTQGDLYVFDCRHYWHEDGQSMMHFTTDANMTPGYSHNDNYMFRTEGEASDFVDVLRAEWEARPDMIEEARRYRTTMMEYWYDFADDDFGYPDEDKEVA